jgi:hypothetical protein
MERHKQLRQDKSDKEVKIGLYEIDETIKYYFDNTIIPRITDGKGRQMKIPVVYGSPERWKSVQKSSFYRDDSGKVQFPLIMYRRTGMTKTLDIGNKVDANNPQVGYTENQYSKTNAYDRFSKAIKMNYIRKFSKMVIPDYVKLSYECIIWTDYLQDMNKIVEAINFAEGTYWGDPKKFSFISKVDSFSGTQEVEVGQDRLIKTSFNIELDGFIITDNIQKQIVQGSTISFSPAKVSVGLETIADIGTIRKKL